MLPGVLCSVPYPVVGRQRALIDGGKGIGWIMAQRERCRMNTEDLFMYRIEGEENQQGRTFPTNRVSFVARREAGSLPPLLKLPRTFP